MTTRIQHADGTTEPRTAAHFANDLRLRFTSSPNRDNSVTNQLRVLRKERDRLAEYAKGDRLVDLAGYDLRIQQLENE